MPKNLNPKSWWGKKWLTSLEEIGWTQRLLKGRALIREEREIRYSIHNGQVKASISTNTNKNYSIQIYLLEFTAEVWDQIIDIIATRAEYMASLLSNELSEELDSELFKKGVSLFPTSAHALKGTICNCSDFANPCKHISAIYHLLSLDLDLDPFILFKLRGRDREEIIEAVRIKREQLFDKDSLDDLALFKKDYACYKRDIFEEKRCVDAILEENVGDKSVLDALLKLEAVPYFVNEDNFNAIIKEHYDRAKEKAYKFIKVKWE